MKDSMLDEGGNTPYTDQLIFPTYRDINVGY